MDHLDDMLSRLREAPLDPRLAGLDSRVMAEIARVCKPGGRVIITNHFQRDTGFLSRVERLAAPLSSLLGWHSDFAMDRVLQEDRLSVEQTRRLPPMGMMTLLELSKA